MRKVFLDVGTQDGSAALEALKEEHGFHKVFAFDADELKVDFARLHMLDIASMTTQWIVDTLLLTDRVFLRIGRPSAGLVLTDLLTSGALKRCHHLLIDAPVNAPLQPFCRDNDITVHTVERLADGNTKQEAFARWFRVCNVHAQSLAWLLPCLHPHFAWVSAMYGSGNHCVDVTRTLAAKIRQQGRLLVSNDLCGVDPCPGIGKQLSIKCIVNNVERTVQSWEGCNLFVTDRPATVISFMLRCRNEEKTLLRALTTLEHLLDVGVGYEIVVVLHKCTDQSLQIADDYARTAPVRVRVLEYDLDVSRPGLETFVTDDSHECSLVSYYNWCFAQTWAPFVWKWDGDFEMNGALASEVLDTLSQEQHDNRPLTIKIFAKSIDGRGDFEQYLSSATVGYTKQAFWEVACFLSGVRSVTLKNWFLHNDSPKANPKPYWEAEPWFAHHGTGLGYVFKRRFEAIKRWLEEPVAYDMARSCSASFNESLFKRLKDVSMSEIDRLWAETTVVISSCGEPHLLRRTIESFVAMNTATVKGCIIIETSGSKGINDFVADLCPFPVNLIYKPQAFEHALDLVRTEFVANVKNGTVFGQRSFIEKAVPVLFTDPKVLCVCFGNSSTAQKQKPFDFSQQLAQNSICEFSCLQLPRVARMHGQHNCRAKFEASGHFALLK